MKHFKILITAIALSFALVAPVAAQNVQDAEWWAERFPVIGGLDQRDGANLPVNVVGGDATNVVSTWNGTLRHTYGNWRRGGEVELQLGDCDRSTMDITWRARNRDGVSPTMLGDPSGCVARYHLNEPGIHEFAISYYWHGPENRRSTEQSTAPARFPVEESGFRRFYGTWWGKAIIYTGVGFGTAYAAGWQRAGGWVR